MGNTNDQHDEFIVPDFVEYAIVADAKPPQASQVARQGRAEICSGAVAHECATGFDGGLCS